MSGHLCEWSDILTGHCLRVIFVTAYEFVAIFLPQSIKHLIWTATPYQEWRDILTKLRGGKVFSKLDMSQAYIQLPLDSKSKKYVVVNTHKGLFQHNRLPFSISSALGIFQRAMDILLQDIPSVVVYFDEILVTGASNTEHLTSYIIEY